jgi:hypothetical protein
MYIDFGILPKSDNIYDCKNNNISSYLYDYIYTIIFIPLCAIFSFRIFLFLIALSCSIVTRYIFMLLNYSVHITLSYSSLHFHCAYLFTTFSHPSIFIHCILFFLFIHYIFIFLLTTFLIFLFSHCIFAFISWPLFISHFLINNYIFTVIKHY